MTRSAHPLSYYAATAADSAVCPALAGDLDCDICVIGGGYTGLSAALELARRGYDVVLLEANRVGWGASGRNGGQIVTGYSGDHVRLFRRQAKALTGERVARHRIACDLKWGYIFAADKPRQLRELTQAAEHWSRDYDYAGLEPLDRPAIAARVGSRRYCGGLYDPGGGHLHPLNYALGLATAASAAGVRLFEGSAVTRIDTGPRPAAHTAAGRVEARHLVLAGNAYLDRPRTPIRRYIMPVGSYIAATEPLGEARAGALIPGDEAVADCNFIINYYRLSADRRLLFGGRASYSTLEPRDLARFMRRKMLSVYPQLADARIDYTWGGLIGITSNRLPHFGRLGGEAYFAHGFSGHGVALSNLAGKLIAEAVAGTAERFDLFARIPHLPFPGGPLRTPLLVLAMLYYRLRDLL
jgi:gamma-glutamylputrescine oxidase